MPIHPYVSALHCFCPSDHLCFNSCFFNEEKKWETFIFFKGIEEQGDIGREILLNGLFFLHSIHT